MSAERSTQPRVPGLHASTDTQYVVYGEIASGGMASVRYGRLLGSRGFSRPVAIKRLHPQFAQEPEFVTMFIDEARLSARLLHANIIHTLDVIELPGEVALVMEYVHGESLWTLLRLARAAGTPIPVRVACGLISSVLHGLHAAHEARGDAGEALQVVHRDVSPQNILIGSDGVPRLLDFGIAKALGRLRSTPHGEIKGKLGYIACEQLHGKRVDRRTDVYGASSVLWETLAGMPVFDGESEPEIVHRVLYDPVPPPSSQRRDIPAGLDAIVLRGLNRDPAKRFATAHDMALAIEREVGIATQSEVKAWLHGLAGERLRTREATLTAMQEHLEPERHPQRKDAIDGTRRLPRTAAHADPQTTALASRRTAAPDPRRRAKRRVWLLCGVVAAGSLGCLWALGESSRPRRTPTVVVQSDASAARGPGILGEATAAGEFDPAVPAEVLPDALQTPALEIKTAVVVEAAAPKHRAKGPAAHGGEPAAPRSTPKSQGRDACALYYYLDDRGIRRPKPECL